MLVLRPHQEDVIEQLREGFRQGHKAQLLYAPTGFGKTEVAIALMKATAEKYNRAAMVLDRIVLVNQTSDRLDKYNLDHGVLQAGHFKFDRSRRLQVCSAQTLERMKKFPDVDLLIVDECHITRKQTSEFIKNNPHIKVIGLTATPFTKGLGQLYTNVVCGLTTADLVKDKWLTPLKVYISKEIDMTGAKKVAGEWSQDVVTERGMKLTGDIVQEWIKKTHEIFGEPKKTIVFCAGVAHGADLVKQFAEHGYNFVSISYKDDSEYKKQAIADFSRPDTQIHGLIATDILTRGFDVSDVSIGVSARPFSKSLSSHIQQMGRVMRPHPDKKFAVWLDHSGNYLRFRADWDEVYTDGVKELDSRLEKVMREPTEKVKKEAKCVACDFLLPKNSECCPSCGHVIQKRNSVVTVAGQMQELLLENFKAKKDEKQVFYSELLYIAKEKSYNPNWASHIYREKFGVWPKGLQHTLAPPTVNTVKWIQHKNIKWAKSKERMAA
jgi:superfamily II DNA or RNA helicase